MTASDQIARPVDAPPPGPEWKPIPGAQNYEASHRGLIRSVDHTTRGRFYEGVVLKPRLDSDGYKVFNITLDSGERKRGVSVARYVLLAHAGPPPDPEMQACHGPGGQRDNRWPENLRWDTDEANREDWRRDNPPRPKPAKVCIVCQREHTDPGRRCRPCLTELGRLAAERLAGGADDLEALAKELDYPSAPGVFWLAVRYGSLRCTTEPVLVLDEVNAAMRELGRGEGKSAAALQAFGRRDSPSWLQRVMARRFGRGDTP